MDSKEPSKLRFYTRHHALAHKIRKDSGIEVLPADVEKNMYVYVCWQCGEEQWTVEMKGGVLVRPVGAVECSRCGAMNTIKGEDEKLHTGGT